MSGVAAVALVLLCNGKAWAQGWERLGPEGGMVVSTGVGAGGEVYLGTADGHVFASKDQGKSWELRGRVGRRLDGVVTRIASDAHDENRIFAAVWYQEPGAGGGVFESVDHGRNWKLLGLANEAVRALEISSSQPEQLVAGTRTGVFRSVDRGKSWTRISPEGDEEIRNLDSLAIDPRDPEVIYAGTYHLPWLTRDAGENWKPIIAGIIDDSDIMSLRLDVNEPSRVYMSACSGIYRSENQGTQWTKLQGIPYAARRTQVIAQDLAEPKTLYAGTTEGLWVTRDGGENWARTTSKDWVVNSIVVLGSATGTAGRVLLGTERGVEVSDDGGQTFAEANRGFRHVVVKQLIADPYDSAHLAMIVQRHASELRESHDGGKSWTTFSLKAEAGTKPFSSNVEDIQEILASPWGWVARLDTGRHYVWQDEGRGWKEWKPTLAAKAPVRKGTERRAARAYTERLVVKGAVAFSRTDAYLATNEGVLRCGTSGECARVGAYGHRGEIRSIFVSPSNQEVDVVMDGKLGLSTNGGVTAMWQDLPVPANQVLWIDAAGQQPEGQVYVGTSTGLFVFDHGAGWKRMKGGLPPGQVNSWVQKPDLWMVGERDGGLYLSQDKGASWKRVDSDAERSQVSGLVGLPDGAILVGSQSEGLLRLGMGKKSARDGGALLFGTLVSDSQAWPIDYRLDNIIVLN